MEEEPRQPWGVRTQSYGIRASLGGTPAARRAEGSRNGLMEEKQILCVGLVVLDIINVVDKYPEEDTDSR